MTRRLLPALLACLAVPAAAQPTDEASGENYAVETIELLPGDAIVIGFSPGYSHQLLRIRHRGDEALNVALEPGEVRASLWVGNGRSELRVENATDEPLDFTALADRRGTGGFSPVAVATVPPGADIAAGRWNFAVHAVTIGEFSYGQQTLKP